MGWLDWLTGTKPQKKNYWTPQQQQAGREYYEHPIQQTPLYGAGSDFLMKILSQDPEMMKQFEAPYMRQFNEQIAPGIAQRFATAGTGAGATLGSGFTNSMSQAGSALQEQLASMRANLGMQAAGGALQYAQQPYNNTVAGAGMSGQYLQPGTTGVLPYAAGGLAAGAGAGMVGPLANWASGWWGGQPQAGNPGGGMR